LQALRLRVCRLRVLWVVPGSAMPGIVVCFVFKPYRYTDTHSFMTKTNLAIAASNTHCFIIIIAFLFYPHCSPVLFF